MRSAKAMVICKEILPEATIEEYSSKLDVLDLENVYLDGLLNTP